MTRTVHKYPLSMARAIGIRVPVESIPVHVGLSNGEVCIWLDVDTELRYEVRTYMITGTGHGVPNNANHMGSVITPEELVWHVWEIKKVS